MRRDYRGIESGHETEIVEGDTADIDSCNIVLAMALAPSWGTAMEIKHASDEGKLVIAINIDVSPSPWLLYHADAIRPTIAAACDLLINEAA